MVQIPITPGGKVDFNLSDAGIILIKSDLHAKADNISVPGESGTADPSSVSVMVDLTAIASGDEVWTKRGGRENEYIVVRNLGNGRYNAEASIFDGTLKLNYGDESTAPRITGIWTTVAGGSTDDGSLDLVLGAVTGNRPDRKLRTTGDIEITNSANLSLRVQIGAYLVDVPFNTLRGLNAKAANDDEAIITAGSTKNAAWYSNDIGLEGYEGFYIGLTATNKLLLAGRRNDGTGNRDVTSEVRVWIVLTDATSEASAPSEAAMVRQILPLMGNNVFAAIDTQSHNPVDTGQDYATANMYWFVFATSLTGAGRQAAFQVAGLELEALMKLGQGTETADAAKGGAYRMVIEVGGDIGDVYVYAGHDRSIWMESDTLDSLQVRIDEMVFTSAGSERVLPVASSNDEWQTIDTSSRMVTNTMLVPTVSEVYLINYRDPVTMEFRLPGFVYTGAFMLLMPDPPADSSNSDPTRPDAVFGGYGDVMFYNKSSDSSFQLSSLNTDSLDIRVEKLTFDQAPVLVSPSTGNRPFASIDTSSHNPVSAGFSWAEGDKYVCNFAEDADGTNFGPGLLLTSEELESLTAITTGSEASAARAAGNHIEWDMGTLGKGYIYANAGKGVFIENDTSDTVFVRIEKVQ